jgi:hypothetical protein
MPSNSMAMVEGSNLPIALAALAFAIAAALEVGPELAAKTRANFSNWWIGERRIG